MWPRIRVTTGSERESSARIINGMEKKKARRGRAAVSRQQSFRFSRFSSSSGPWHARCWCGLHDAGCQGLAHVYICLVVCDHGARPSRTRHRHGHWTLLVVDVDGWKYQFNVKNTHERAFGET